VIDYRDFVLYAVGNIPLVVIEANRAVFPLGHGIADLENPKVLELPPFDRLGSKTAIRRRIFGGADKFSAALTELEQELYRESA
jgi:hypothetical protein